MKIKQELNILQSEVLTFCSNECPRRNCEGCPLNNALNRLDFMIAATRNQTE